MSKVKIEGNASGTGTFTIAAPNSNTDRSITLPDAAGELLLANGDGSNLTGISSPDSTPSFGVRLATSQTFNNGTTIKVACATEDWDTDSAWDTTNYKFTVPAGEAGKYSFNYKIHIASDLSTSYSQRSIDVYLSVNGTTIQPSRHRSLYGSSNHLFFGGAFVLDLSAGDYVEFYATQETGSNYSLSSTGTYFSGHKLAGV